MLIVLPIAVTIGVVGMMAIRSASEKMSGLEEKIAQIDSPATVIYARDGKTLLYRASTEYRKLIDDYDDIPKLVINATLAAEDKRFFEHIGVDWRAVFRSLRRNVTEGRQAQGASTITMQLVKRLYTSTEKSWQRKMEDAALAIELERRLDKKTILRAYLNQVYYGQGAYGIRAAADVYFGKKELRLLTVGEAAMLARMVRRPSDENPIANLEAAMTNRDVVLNIMRSESMITEAQWEKAKAEKPKLTPKKFGSGERIYFAPYFTRYVLESLKREYPDTDLGVAGWTVITTLDPDLQLVAEDAVKDLVRKYRRSHVTTAAFVLLDSEGQILALQGNLDWEKDEFNVITQGRRQPGSAFKPFVYAAALSTGAIRPGDRISNEPFILRDNRGRIVWAPKNSGGKSGGTISIPMAIANSKNLPAVHVTQLVGTKTAAAYCRDVFGFTSPIQPFDSMALGTNEVSPLEMAEGYSVFQSRGHRFTPFPIAQIYGLDKETIRAYQPKIIRNILDTGVASYMDMCLREVVTQGTGKAASGIRDSRGKTGTTQEARDAWFCGYTNNLMGIGWIANVRYNEKGVAKYEEMRDSVFGGTVTVQMWTQVLRAAQKKRGYGTAPVGAPLVRYDNGVEGEGARKPVEPKTEPQVIAPDATKTEPVPIGPDTTTPDGQGTLPVDVPPETPVKTEPKTEPKTDPPPQTAPEESGVEVEVCAESGQKATIYCPETVTRNYSRNGAPKRWCRKHSPAP